MVQLTLPHKDESASQIDKGIRLATRPICGCHSEICHCLDEAISTFNSNRVYRKKDQDSVEKPLAVNRPRWTAHETSGIH